MDTRITVLAIAAGVTLPTVAVSWLLGRRGGASGLCAAVIGCGLVVPGAMLLYVVSQARHTGGVGYGDAMGLGVIMVLAGLVTPFTLLTAYLTIRRVQRRTEAAGRPR